MISRGGCGIRSGALIVNLPGSLKAVNCREGKKAMVFVRQSATEYVPKEVTLGAKQDGYTQVLEGVQPGDEVVTTGSHVLRSEMLKERIGGED